MEVAAAPTAAATTPAEVRLPPADAWVTEVLQSCARVHHTPQKELLRVLAPVNAAVTATAVAAAPAQSSFMTHSGSGVVDVDAEEDAAAVTPASPDSPDLNSYQPYLPNVPRAAPTAEAQTVRAALPASLLRKAYRVQLPCVTSHSTKGDRLLNCAASPRCMAGLRTLAGDAVTRDDCLQVAMGEGPNVVGVPPPSGAAAAAHKAGASEQAAAATAVRSVTADPTFPCLWRGVRNLMNTCYFSSVLQLVFSVAGLRRAILQEGVATAGEPSATTAAAGATPVATQLEESGLRELFALMAFSREGGGADPKSFASYLSLDVKVQQDAQEFFTLLLDWLRCHCGPAVQAAVTSAFSGTLLYDRRCGACGRSAKRAEPFLYLSLPVRPTLEDSLSEFSKPEEVDGFMCEGCNQTAVATSRQYMRTLPDVLVVHWNRFEFDLHTLQRHKVTTATSFPVQLDMTPYTRQWHAQKRNSTTTATAAAGESAKAELAEEEKEQQYELRGIVNHHGDTALSGHYTYHGKVSKGGATGVAEGQRSGGSSASSSTWLSFNDAEVTPLNRYQGQRGVSADAYLLVYHRVSTAAITTTTPAAPAATTGAVDAAPVAVAPSWAAPAPAEFPMYLRQYVDQVNQRCLEERQAWLDQRTQVASLFDLWAATAQAVFDASAPASFSAAAGGTGSAAATQSSYALPTAWLQQLGRLFLPAYVDVAALGGGAESQLKRKRKELGSNGGGSGTGEAGGEGGSGSGAASHLSGGAAAAAAADGDKGSSPLENAPVEGVVVSAMVGPRRHGHIRSVDEVYQLVRQHSLLQALPTLSCPHGSLAPWGSYKLVSAAAYAKLSHFLQVCGAPLKAAATAATEGEGAAVDAQSSCAFVESNLCPLCVAAMAATVKGLAVAAVEDEQAELALTHAWREAERRKDAEEGDVSTGASASVHKDCSAQSLDNAEDGEAEGREGHVLVSETVVEGWASFYVSQQAWARVQQAEGYTAVVVMREARLSPPRIASAATSAAPRMASSNSGSGATSPPSPTSPTGSTTALTVSHTLADAEDAIGIAALNVDKGDLDLSSQLLCAHGALRPGQHVVAVPASLRRYWIRRFTEVLTVAHRAGQLRTADPAWRVSEEEVGHFLLPFIPASTTSTTCRECMRTSVQALTSRHHERLRKMEERKKFPSLWLAGAMTSTAGVAQLLLATGAETEEQLLAAQHPNRLFYKHNAEREYRDYVRRWTEAQQARTAHQEAEVTRLQTTVAKKKEHDAAWNARVTTRRGGRGGMAAAAAAAAVSPDSAATPPDPETLEGRLYYAEEALASLRAQAVPDFDVTYGCVPTWWVARWYAAMQDDAPRKTAPASAPAASGEGQDGEGEDGPEGMAVRLPPIAFHAFKCEHGGCLLEVPWLNPTDGFWQGVRGKRAEVLWNGVRVERATSDPSAAAAAAAASSEGPGQAEYRSACWLPPLTILPMEEYLALLAQYGTPQMLAKAMSSATAAATADKSAVTDVDATPDATASAEATASPLTPVPEAVIQLVTHNGTRQLQPAPCAACCAQLLAAFEENCQSFVNGSLKLNFHIKKSRKNFYDASSVLTSAAVQQSRKDGGETGEGAAAEGSHAGAAITVKDDDEEKDAEGGGIPDGIHYYTTLAQLRVYIRSHLRERHGYLVQPEDLQITRGKNKPLKLRSPPPQQQQSGTQSEEAALENASLHDLGIRDGDTLLVQSVDAIAQVCATAPGVEEEWEAIPPELLQAGNHSSSGGRPGVAATAAREHAAAFRETRLQGSHAGGASGAAAAATAATATSSSSTAGAVIGAVVSGGGGGSSVPQEDQPVSCAVCTFLNAPGMVVCEMCEAPLPAR